jgi:hypothetical protein
MSAWKDLQRRVVDEVPVVEGVPEGEAVPVVDEESSVVVPVPEAEAEGEAVPEPVADAEALEELSLAKYCH